MPDPTENKPDAVDKTHPKNNQESGAQKPQGSQPRENTGRGLGRGGGKGRRDGTGQGKGRGGGGAGGRSK